MKVNLFFLVTVLLSFCNSFPAFVLKGVLTDNTTVSFRTNFVDNLLSNLYETINNKKAELEDPELWPKDYSVEALKQGLSMYDYIVIGAGSAGSVVASRLSEDPHIKVLVLEAGGDPPILSEIHSLSMLLQNTPYTWNDYAEPNPNCCQAMKGGRCYWPRGKMIGGTGGINGNVFLMGRPEDFDEWHQQGNEGWSWNDVYPFYEKATTELGNETQPMGSLTLNYFQRLESFHILKDLMINGNQELEQTGKTKSRGFRENITATIVKGKRMSTGKTYLGKVSKIRNNLHVMKQSVATKLIFNNRLKVVGVDFLVNGSAMLRAKARREIILSAGTFNTPKLLLLSGIGPSVHLKSLNVPTLKNLQVGENLQDHGMMPLILKFNKNVPNMQDEVLLESVFDYFMHQKGPLASSTTLVGFINTLGNGGNQNKSDLMLVTQITKPTKASNTFEFLQFKDELTSRFLERIDNQTVLQIQGLIIKSKSRGYVKLRSSDPLQGPFIYNNYALDLEDRLTLLRYVRFIQQLTKTVQFQYYGLELITIPLEECDLFAFDSDDYWLCYVKYFFISAWHAVGTCRMGPATDSSAIVDARLRVHGIKGLRVIDASIMPNITSANTNGPTIMIAERGAQLVKDDWSNNIQ